MVRRTATGSCRARLRARAGAVVIMLAVSGCTGAVPHSAPAESGPPGSSKDSPTAAVSPSASPSHRRTQPPAPWLAPVGPKAKGHLRKGSDPSALPSDLLIADKVNNRLIIVDRHGRIRWQFPRRGDLAHGQTFRIPD
ncbi:MAG: hypothetical protein J2P23_00205, partial [Microlunatus sp.]|nr:hypothetical protein [Microlunatus sp.]